MTDICHERAPAPHMSLAQLPDDTSRPVIFFDGVCGLCNRFVDFVIARDHRRVFRFAPLQGRTGSERLQQADIADLSSVVLVDHSGTHRRSSAIVRILWGLAGFWRLAAIVVFLVPRPLRDFGYKIVARDRYFLFGKKGACRLPTAVERELFLP